MWDQEPANRTDVTSDDDSDDEMEVEPPTFATANARSQPSFSVRRQIAAAATAAQKKGNYNLLRAYLGMGTIILLHQQKERRQH